MSAKLYLIIPEIILVVGAVLVTVLGLSRAKALRDAVPGATVGLIILAFLSVFAVTTDERLAAAGLLMPGLVVYGKSLILLVSASLVLLGVGLVDRRLERAIGSGQVAFDPIRVQRGEHHAFLLLSIAGACLLCNAPDFIWAFLAVELVSLPTYIVVASSKSSRKAQEAAVKYFFLGALSSAVLLYGIALLYGATGTVELEPMRQALAAQAASGGISTLAIVGGVLAILGLCYKISAVPMHFYAPDVYEGAATPVTAFLAFIPKAAGFLALILVLDVFGWSGHSFTRGDDLYIIERGLPQPITALLWMIAVLTMTLGNIGALLQKNVKRMLAYSSVAHSGYMMIGLIAGPAGIDGVSGINATLFYLLSYAIMNVATFGPLASLERNGEEIETFDDIAGLRQRHPWMAASLAIGAGSLIGLPPLLGFWAKLYIFMAGLEAGQWHLVLVAAINSGISVWYYLRLINDPLVAQPTARSETVTNGPSIWPRAAAIVTAGLLIVAPLMLGRLVSAANGVTRGEATTAVAAPPTETVVSDASR
ncbi:MAG: NADH-quinone oxidoreductase subunit N [Phycisphaerae bacterium]|nr:NADH-quinone oxidoreductase subunit N [Phycisphaerae bacterium]